jgi:hypothetical protein
MAVAAVGGVVKGVLNLCFCYVSLLISSVSVDPNSYPPPSRGPPAPGMARPPPPLSPSHQGLYLTLLHLCLLLIDSIGYWLKT